MPTAGRIALFALGGTIAAPVDATGANARITQSADEIVRDLLGADTPSIDARTFRSAPSAALSFADLRALATETDAAVADGVDGIVVSVGTDTLEEVAYTLDLLYGGEAALVVTGAMRNAGLPGADGAANLRAAIAVARHPDARHQGALVVLADEIHLARHVRKMHTSSIAAFGSPGAGPIGSLVEGRPTILVRRLRRPAPLTIGDSSPAVRLLRVSLDDDPAVVDEALAAGVDSLVIETFGAGHVGPAWVGSLRRAAATVPVVYTSRTGEGGLYRSTAAYPGSERDLLEAGLIPASGFDGLKARVLLRHLLAAGAGRDAIAARFAEG